MSGELCHPRPPTLGSGSVLDSGHAEVCSAVSLLFRCAFPWEPTRRGLFYTCLSACTSALVEGSVRLLTRFLTRLFVFSLLSSESSLHILNKYLSCLQIFSPSQAFLPTLLILAFTELNFLFPLFSALVELPGQCRKGLVTGKSLPCTLS